MKRKKTKKNRKKGAQPYPTPPVFPCGCKAYRAASDGYKVKVLILENGLRVCECGFVWKAVWERKGHVSTID
jgi:hypothetical protein